MLAQISFLKAGARIHEEEFTVESTKELDKMYDIEKANLAFAREHDAFTLSCSEADYYATATKD